MKSYGKFSALILALAASQAGAQVSTTSSASASDLAAALAGTGLTITGSTLTTSTQNGFFTNGSSSVGIGSGVVLTTGTLACASGTNTSSSCGGAGTGTSLSIDFTVDTASLFFNYVFGSEEYNEFVGSQFNDTFSLILNGPGFTNVNLAQLPGSGGVVSINNVNNGSNSAFFRDNTLGGLPIQLDGLTTILTASAFGLTPGAAYNLAFNISDVGDSILDSAVFIQGASVGTTPPVNGAIPEPSTWAMMLLGFGAVGASMRRRGGKIATPLQIA